ncbi:MAG: FprA family A-type flavoprotein [Pseudobutyrivibrio sp.]|nr:FprA family A-type flavoprotein [Pseudobutyrivibrio sp.]
MITISDSIKFVGVNDKTLDLFESQYPIPNGVSYNSYVIMDEKIAIMDSVDPRATTQWLSNLDSVLAGKTPDYLVVSHMEPDHSGSIKDLLSKFPSITLVGNTKTFTMLGQFIDISLVKNQLVVKEGDQLDLGSHSLTFLMAPMVHWPEVMVEYESTEKIIFSADGFGKFGSLDTEEPWADEARRYYLNIVGKYGPSVQALLKKLSSVEVKTICPLHGPVLTGDLTPYLDLYHKWSTYTPEEKGVFIACASIHGNTKKIAADLCQTLTDKGIKAEFYDLTRGSLSEAVAKAFYYDTMVCAASTYDGGVFLPMEDFINHLRAKAFQNRKIAFIENGTWGPMAAKTMRALFEPMKSIEFIDPVVTVKSTLDPTSEAALADLVQALSK